MTIPVFGEKLRGVDYQARYGVYAVIPNPEQTGNHTGPSPNGAWFYQAVKLRLAEGPSEPPWAGTPWRIRFTATIGQYYGQADEYFYSCHRDTHYYNPAYLYEVTSYTEIDNPWKISTTLPGSLLITLLKTLKRGSHKWGIGAMENRKMCKKLEKST